MHLLQCGRPGGSEFARYLATVAMMVSVRLGQRWVVAASRTSRITNCDWGDEQPATLRNVQSAVEVVQFSIGVIGKWLNQQVACPASIKVIV